MDAVQDQADYHVLVLSKEYLASDYCKHEMDRAIDKDPHFKLGKYLRFSRREVSEWVQRQRGNSLAPR
jgi:hypothetical protein